MKPNFTTAKPWSRGARSSTLRGTYVAFGIRRRALSIAIAGLRLAEVMPTFGGRGAGHLQVSRVGSDAERDGSEPSEPRQRGRPICGLAPPALRPSHGMVSGAPCAALTRG